MPLKMTKLQKIVSLLQVSHSLGFSQWRHRFSPSLLYYSKWWTRIFLPASTILPNLHTESSTNTSTDLW